VKHRLFLLTLFIFAVLTDQLTKAAIHSSFELYQAKKIIPHFLSLRYIRNSGVAFGLQIGHPTIMLALTILVILILAYLYFKERLFANRLSGQIAMMFVFGGAFGNLIDRIRFGEVIDFIQMGIGPYTWPVYNFADVFVTIGMFILIALYWIGDRDTEPQSPPQ
jgi:signal peptidase II